jgi:threonine/homoserine/homoserine lactone efflux protein
MWLDAGMTLEAWAAFAAASTILLIIPGPTVLLVVSYALAAARARSLVRNERVISIVNKTGGTLLVGAGVATVAYAGRHQ